MKRKVGLFEFLGELLDVSRSRSKSSIVRFLLTLITLGWLVGATGPRVEQVGLWIVGPVGPPEVWEWSRALVPALMLAGISIWVWVQA
jgi:hypothetical protein